MPDERPDGLTPIGPRGGQPFVWVQDNDTGHRYDVPEYAILPGMTPVEGYEKNWTGMARPTKYRLGDPPAEPVRVDEPSGDAVQARKVAAANSKSKQEATQ